MFLRLIQVIIIKYAFSSIYSILRISFHDMLMSLADFSANAIIIVGSWHIRLETIFPMFYVFEVFLSQKELKKQKYIKIYKMCK